MSADRFDHESDADYLERLANADIEVPPGRYELDRPIHFGRNARLRVASTD